MTEVASRKLSRWTIVIVLMILGTLFLTDRHFGEIYGTMPIHIVEGVDAKIVFGPGATAFGPEALGQDFDVLDDGTIMVQVGDHLFALRRSSSGSVYFTQVATVGELRSFTGNTAGAVVATTADKIVSVAPGGNLTLANLPGDANYVRLARSATDGQVYLYGAPFDDRVLSLTRGGDVINIVRTNADITGVAEAPSALYFSTAHEIYSYNGRFASLIIRVPDYISITSVAIDSGNDLLFFATADRVYAMRGLTAVSIATGIGGSIRLSNHVLFVLDTDRRELLRLADADKI